jgi:peptide-methionine (S)-S-oxide reductase
MIRIKTSLYLSLMFLLLFALSSVPVLAGGNAETAPAMSADKQSDAAGNPNSEGPNSGETKLATFGAGCFWGVEASFEKTEGVVEAVSGYAGGYTKDPTYNDVCSGETGHAEVVQVEYDPSIITYEQLLAAFWAQVDPVRQLPDGYPDDYQYRSIILYHDNDQKAAAERAAEKLAAQYDKPVTVQIVPLEEFYPAEPYHQDYYTKGVR